MTAGIVSWGVYLPFWRLQRSAIGQSLGSPAGRGARRVASFDEDTTTMGVEASRRALSALDGERPQDLVFSTPVPAYLDKTNAAAIHAALDLDDWAGAYDVVGSVRSGVAALRSAAGLANGRRTMAVVSDVRTGLAGGAEERDSGDGAVAIVFGDATVEPVAAEIVATGAASGEFLDRWRVPGETQSKVWEERFGQEVYLPLAQSGLDDALKRAGVSADALDHVIVSGLHARAVAAAKSSLGVSSDVIVDDRVLTTGNLGAAQPAFLLADVLEGASPDQLIALVVLADGADVVILRTTQHIGAAQAARVAIGVSPVRELVESGRDDLPYARFLTWRGELRREPPRRPDPERPGAPTMWRSSGWKERFEASTCEVCGFRHLPPTRVCLKCQSVDQMRLERLADVKGRIATFTIDHLAFSLSPPVVGAVVDFDGGGRYRCEMTDVDPTAVAIGGEVEMTFRRLYTAQGVHNYFWKAKPVEGAKPVEAARLAEPNVEGAQS